jgi:hypothetical protein
MYISTASFSQGLMSAFTGTDERMNAVTKYKGISDNNM